MTWNPITSLREEGKPTGDPMYDRYLDPQPGDHLFGDHFTWHLFLIRRDETGVYAEVHFPTKDHPEGGVYDPEPKRLRFRNIADFVAYYATDPPYGSQKNEPSARCQKLIAEWDERGDYETLPFVVNDKIVKARLKAMGPEAREVYEFGVDVGKAEAEKQYKHLFSRLRDLAPLLPS